MITLDTKAGREAQLVVASTYESLIHFLGTDQLIDCQLFGRSGFATEGRAIGAIKRHLNSSSSYGWPSGQLFAVRRCPATGRWFAFCGITRLAG